jgi:hypothetical protein
MTPILEPVGIIKEQKVRELHDFLLKEFEWGGTPHLIQAGSQFVTSFHIGDRKDVDIKKWFLASPLGKFEFVLAVSKIADSPIYKAEQAFGNLMAVLTNPAGGFLFGAVCSKKGQFKVSNNWVVEVLGFSDVAIFKYGI